MMRCRNEVWFWNRKILRILPKSLEIRKYYCIFRLRYEEFFTGYKTATHFKMKILDGSRDENAQ